MKPRPNAFEKDEAHQRDVDGERDHARAHVHAGGHARPLDREGAGRRVGDGGVSQAEADASESAAGQHRQPTRVLAQGSNPHDDEPQPDREETKRDHHAWPAAQQPPFGERRHDQRRQRVGEQCQPGRYIAQPMDGLEIDRQIDDERPEAEVHPRRAKQRAREGARTEGSEIEHRSGGPRLDRDEGEKARDADACQRKPDGIAGVHALSLRDEEDEAEYGERQGRDPGKVDTDGLGIGRFDDTRARQHERNHRQPDMDEEHPFPARDGSDQTSDQGAEAQADPEDDPPPTERHAALRAFTELVRKDGDLAGQHRRAAPTLEEAGGDQQRRIRRKPARQRGGAEDHDADQEDPPAPIAVAQRAHRHQAGGHRNRIGVHDPLELPEVGWKDMLQRRQDRRDARNLQPQHQGR